MADNDTSSRTCAYVLNKQHEEAVALLAASRYDDNKSMAARRIIEHAEATLFPLLGIARPAVLPQEPPA